MCLLLVCAVLAAVAHHRVAAPPERRIFDWRYDCPPFEDGRDTYREPYT
jgi:hypothetical protein